MDRDQFFGASVAISGDTIAVGVPGDFVNTNINQGSVQIFARTGNTWARQAQVSSADGTDADLFGSAVSIDGDILAVAAEGDDDDRGAAYVFLRAGSAWAQQAKLTAPVRQPLDRFGAGVAVTGTTVVAGAPSVDVGSTMDAGAAYVFVRSATGWSLQTQLLAGDGAAEDYFGVSVAARGDHVLVGAMGDDLGVFEGVGSAYLYRRTGVSWSLDSKLEPSPGSSGEAGVSVALSNTARLLGAWRSAAGGSTNQGAAFAFGPAPAAPPVPVVGLGWQGLTVLVLVLALFATLHPVLRRSSLR
jgi:hypothetical protein